MTIENLTGQDRILLWDITGQHPANERADAVAKALRLIGKLTEALAAADARAEQQTRVAFSYEESLQRAEARVRELEAQVTNECRPVARCLVCGFENTGRAPYGCDCDKREALRGS